MEGIQEEEAKERRNEEGREEERGEIEVRRDWDGM